MNEDLLKANITKDKLLEARRNFGRMYADLIIESDGTIPRECRLGDSVMEALFFSLVPMLSNDAWDYVIVNIAAIQEAHRAYYGNSTNKPPMTAQMLYEAVREENPEAAEELMQAMKALGE